jgi:hypothetical protein
MRNPFFTMIMETITSMVENLFLVSILSILYWCVDKKKTVKIAWIIFLSSIANGFLKGVFNVQRPFERGVVSPIREHTATGASFPSGHTQTATSFWAGATVVLKNKKVAILGTLMILLTGLSRLYLGVHWPTDIVGGILFGMLSVLISKEFFDEKKGVRPNHILFASILLLMVMIFPLGYGISSAVACLWGMLFGVYLEKKYIKFKEKQPIKLQLYKVIIGMSGVFLIYFGMTKLLPVDEFVGIIKYALVLLWVTAGAPYIFGQLLGKKK